MKLKQLIKRLQDIEKDIVLVGGNPVDSDVRIEAMDDECDFYYETNFELSVDDNNDIGLSPVKK